MLYDLGFFIFSIFYLPTLIFKGKLHSDFKERFGFYPKDKKEAFSSKKPKIWIQAVSVGEVQLCKTLIPEIKKAFPDHAIVFSTITKTGNGLARKLFSQDATVIYFPLDFSFVVRRSLDLIKPSLYLMIETEIWPNFIKELSLRGIKSVMINGRISDRSIGGYRLAAPFIKNVVSKVDLFCMQSELDAVRIRSIGAPKDRVVVTGTMKFDAVTPRKNDSDGIRAHLGLSEKDMLIVAGSTHLGEAELILSAFEKLTGKFPNLKLMIAPRHIERSDEIEELSKRSGYDVLRLSKVYADGIKYSTVHGSRATVMLLDVIGMLSGLYSIADIVFIGGSLIRHGGQNPLEAAIFEKPILFGPNMFNFRLINDELISNGGAIKVTSGTVYDEMERLLLDPVLAASVGRKAKETVEKNKGATLRNLENIRKVIGL